MANNYEKIHTTFERAEAVAQAEITSQVNDNIERFDSLAEKCDRLNIAGIQPSFNISSITKSTVPRLFGHSIKNLFVPGERYELSQILWTVHNKVNGGQIGGFKSLNEALAFIEAAKVPD